MENRLLFCFRRSQTTGKKSFNLYGRNGQRPLPHRPRAENLTSNVQRPTSNIFYFCTMTFEEKINSDLKNAMLARDEKSVRGLRAIKQAILLAKTSGNGAELAAADEIKMLQKLVKQRKESAEIYHQQGRADLAATEEEEIAIVERYLPKQMSEEEIKLILKEIISTVGATSAADLGKVMGAATKQFAGKADNKIVSALVKQMLS